MEILLHIPHASLELPEVFYDGLRMSVRELNRVLLKHTDRFTDILFARNSIPASIAPYSRYYCDVERFADNEKEPMSQLGQGVVYTHAYDGRLMHEHDSAYLENTMAYYHAYHRRLDRLALDVASKDQAIVVLDCHSYADDVVAYFHPMPYPDVCIGVEEAFFDARILELIQSEVSSEGFTMAINQPFKGALIPNVLLNRRDIKTIAFMLELNHRIYLDEYGAIDSSKAMKVQTMLDRIYEGIRRLT